MRSTMILLVLVVLCREGLLRSWFHSDHPVWASLECFGKPNRNVLTPTVGIPGPPFELVFTSLDPFVERQRPVLCGLYKVFGSVVRQCRVCPYRLYVRTKRPRHDPLELVQTLVVNNEKVGPVHVHSFPHFACECQVRGCSDFDAPLLNNVVHKGLFMNRTRLSPRRLIGPPRYILFGQTKKGTFVLAVSLMTHTAPQDMRDGRR